MSAEFCRKLLFDIFLPLPKNNETNQMISQTLMFIGYSSIFSSEKSFGTPLVLSKRA